MDGARAVPPHACSRDGPAHVRLGVRRSLSARWLTRPSIGYKYDLNISEPLLDAGLRGVQVKLAIFLSCSSHKRCSYRQLPLDRPFTPAVQLPIPIVMALNSVPSRATSMKPSLNCVSRSVDVSARTQRKRTHVAFNRRCNSCADHNPPSRARSQSD